MEQKAGEHGHPDRRGVEQDHGHGRAAEFDGIQGGRIKDAHGPEAENGEQGRVAQRDADLPAQGRVGDEAGGPDGGTPEGGFERTDTGGQAVFGDQADDRPGKDGQQDQNQAVAAGGRGDGRGEGRGHECHSLVKWSHEKNAVSVHSVRKNRTGRGLSCLIVDLPVALACRAGREGARRQFCQLTGGAALHREGLPEPGQEGMDAFQYGVRGLLVRHMRGAAGQHLGRVPEQAQHLSAPLPVQARGPAHDPGRMPERIGAASRPNIRYTKAHCCKPFGR